MAEKDRSGMENIVNYDSTHSEHIMAGIAGSIATGQINNCYFQPVRGGKVVQCRGFRKTAGGSGTTTAVLKDQDGATLATLSFAAADGSSLQKVTAPTSKYIPTGGYAYWDITAAEAAGAAAGLSLTFLFDKTLVA